MIRKLGLAALAGALALPVLPQTALAHHSYAMFDSTKEIELKDVTVAKWDWTNPHTWLYIYVPSGAAEPDRYALEGGNPGVLRRQGFGIGTFKPGDKLTVYMSPLMNGQKGGALLAVVLPGGKMIGQRLQKN
jgi:hypothetical protein